MSVLVNQGDGYDLEFDSDDCIHGISSDSENEINIMLHGTPKQKKRFLKSQQDGASTSEDDFEKEMNAELDAKILRIEDERAGKTCTTIPPSAGTSGTDRTTSDEKMQFYDDIYFDSDSENEDNEPKKTKKRQHPKLSNDDLFYDPDMDDEDQKWMDNKRKSYQPKSKSNKPKPVPESDARLDCPACLTTLCLDCQRHEKYEGQFRAMFVMNCKVDYSEVLKYPQKKDRNKKKGKGAQNNEQSKEPPNDENENYNPVHCSECKTEVAVFDKDEVFHFFNVLAFQA